MIEAAALAALAAAPKIVYNSTHMEGHSAMIAPDPRRRDDAEPDPGDAARALARMAERLSVDRRDPEAFHARKSELIAAIRRHARRLDQGAGR
jgi:hypothetical protein